MLDMNERKNSDLNAREGGPGVVVNNDREGLPITSVLASEAEDTETSRQTSIAVRIVAHLLPSGYSLTWPIWHLLPLSEKVRIAREENLTVGEFEESVALQIAIRAEDDDESLPVSTASPEVEPDSALDETKKVLPSLDLMMKHKEKLSRALGEDTVLGFGVDGEDEDEEEYDGKDVDADEDDNDSDGDNDNGDERGDDKLSGCKPEAISSSIQVEASTCRPDKDAVSDEASAIEAGDTQLSGLFLPIDVLLHSIFSFLQCEVISYTLPLLNSSWMNLIAPRKGFSFTPVKAHTKEIWKEICRRRFYQGTGKCLPVKLPPKFASYRKMFKNRLFPCPHGIYILNTSYVKKITRDMWTSSNLPPGVILKCEWYRYFLFTENCDRKVGYLQSSKTFPELKSKFRKWYVKDRFLSPDPSAVAGDIVTGRFDVFRGGKVRVMVGQKWADIFFELELSRNPQNRYMTLDKHYAVIANGGNIVEYTTPSVCISDQNEGKFSYIKDLCCF